MLNERVYKTAEEARAYLDGLTESFDESILPIGLRQSADALAEFVVAFVDKGRDDYSLEMKRIFSAAELRRDDITGEEVLGRYLERFPNTERYKVSE
jgi:hypothetical protein